MDGALKFFSVYLIGFWQTSITTERTLKFPHVKYDPYKFDFWREILHFEFMTPLLEPLQSKGGAKHIV